MSRSTVLFILFLSVVVVALGYNYFARPFGELFAPEQAAVNEVSPELDQAPEVSILHTLSTREKILQMLAAPLTVVPGSSPSGTVSWVIAEKPGFVTLFGERISTASARQVSDQLTQASKAGQAEDPTLPILIAVDHEGGRVQRLNGVGFTRLPSWQELCQLDIEKREIVLAKSATELAAVGIDIVLAPMVDVASQSAVLGNRVCAGNPEIVVGASHQYAQLFARQGLLPVFKHFPGIGQSRRDLHTQFDRIAVTAEEALVYRSLLTSNPQAGVMVAHVGVENQYPDVPCSLSAACISELHTTFPEALIFSDALDMKAAAYNPTQADKSLAQVSLAAIKAGNQVLVFGAGVNSTDLETIIQTVEAEAKKDPTVVTKIDQAVMTIIRYKLK